MLVIIDIEIPTIPSPTKYSYCTGRGFCGNPSYTDIYSVTKLPKTIPCRWLYWTDWGTPPMIERASMDGTTRTVLHNSGLSRPYALAIDYATQTLYWADDDLDNLQSSSVDGSNRTLLTTANIQSPFAMTFYDGILYWSDTSLNRILSAPVDSPNSFSYVISSQSYDPYGVQVVTEERQPLGEYLRLSLLHVVISRCCTQTMYKCSQ